jgi:hypothetical protein
MPQPRSTAELVRRPKAAGTRTLESPDFSKSFDRLPFTAAQCVNEFHLDVMSRTRRSEFFLGSTGTVTTSRFIKR